MSICRLHDQKTTGFASLSLALAEWKPPETHSMKHGMLAEKYIDKFFGEDAVKYKPAMPLTCAFPFILHGTIVDYFQHIVYENPDMTPAERNAKMEQAWKPSSGHT